MMLAVVVLAYISAGFFQLTAGVPLPALQVQNVTTLSTANDAATRHPVRREAKIDREKIDKLSDSEIVAQLQQLGVPVTPGPPLLPEVKSVENDAQAIQIPKDEGKSASSSNSGSNAAPSTSFGIGGSSSSAASFLPQSVMTTVIAPAQSSASSSSGSGSVGQATISPSATSLSSSSSSQQSLASSANVDAGGNAPQPAASTLFESFQQQRPTSSSGSAFTNSWNQPSTSSSFGGASNGLSASVSTGTSSSKDSASANSWNQPSPALPVTGQSSFPAPSLDNLPSATPWQPSLSSLSKQSSFPATASSISFAPTNLLNWNQPSSLSTGSSSASSSNFGSLSSLSSASSSSLPTDVSSERLFSGVDISSLIQSYGKPERDMKVDQQVEMLPPTEETLPDTTEEQTHRYPDENKSNTVVSNKEIHTYTVQKHRVNQKKIVNERDLKVVNVNTEYITNIRRINHPHKLIEIYKSTQNRHIPEILVKHTRTEKVNEIGSAQDVATKEVKESNVELQPIIEKPVVERVGYDGTSQ